MPSLRIQEMAQEDRPRERLFRLGPAALSTAELMAIIFRTGTKGSSAVDIAAGLLSKHGSLAAIARLGVSGLKSHHGLGITKAVQLLAAFELAKRLAVEQFSSEPMDSPQKVYALLGADMRQMKQEVLRVLLLNTRHCLIRMEDVSKGSVNESIAHPREIFLPAIQYSAHSLIVVHNHPSGDPRPSEADLRLTRRLREAAELLQIRLLDHVIIGTPAEGRQAWYSFRESGIL